MASSENQLAFLRDAPPMSVAPSREALRALSLVSSARTALGKMRCFLRCVECTASAATPSPPTADDLLPALARVVIFSENLKLHAELAFVQAFCRDELLLLGRGGYAVTSISVVLSSLTEAQNGEDAAAVLGF